MAENIEPKKKLPAGAMIAIGVGIGVIVTGVAAGGLFMSGLIPGVTPETSEEEIEDEEDIQDEVEPSKTEATLTPDVDSEGLVGLTIYETTPDGSTKAVGNLSAYAVNFYFVDVANQYAAYGVTSDMWDDVFDQETGETYRDLFLDQAGNVAMNVFLINRAAEEDGYLQYSKADIIAERQVELIEENVSLWGFSSVDQYLENLYGTGMTEQIYTDILTEDILAKEYQAYLQQFQFLPTADEVQAVFDVDPSLYMMADFNMYYIPASVDANGNATNLAEVEAAAEKIAANSGTPEEFRQAVIDYLTEIGDETTLSYFADGNDLTRYEGFSGVELSYYTADISDFIFGSTTTEGETAVITSEVGCYVIRFDKAYLNETSTVTYRVLILNNDTNLDTATTDSITLQADAESQVAKIISGPVDSMSFCNICKEYSVAGDPISGGYFSGVTDLTTMPSDVSDWLLDPSRVQGDYIVKLSQDNTQIEVYYFECCEPNWQYQAKCQLFNNSMTEWSESLQENSPSFEIDKEAIAKISG